MALRAVLFDLDNTLWRPTATPDWGVVTRLQAEALTPALEGLGIKHPDLVDFLTRFWPVLSAADQALNPTLSELKCELIIRDLLRQDGLDCPDGEDECLWEALHIPFRHFNTEPYADAVDAVERLRSAGTRLAVLTNRPVGEHIIARELTSLGFPDAFETIVTSGDVGYRKPHALVFETALHRLGVSPRDVLMIGDSYENDVVPAAKLGMTAVLKLNERERNDAYEMATHQVASFEALLALDLFTVVFEELPTARDG